MQTLNWAVLGCGAIANEMAQTFERIGTSFYAVSNRTYEKAQDFARKYKIQKIYREVSELFYDSNVDIIYITTPHQTHYEFVKQALLHGKHVLCEKAVMLNSRELDECIEIAQQKKLVFAEAMTIWHMPVYKKLWEFLKLGQMGVFQTEEISAENYAYDMIKNGIPALGKVNLIQLNFGSYKEYEEKNRFFNKNLAGGALLDIGVYALSFMRSFLLCQPEDIISQVKYAQTGVDEQSTIILKNSQQQMTAITLSLRSKQPKRAVVSCENGYIEIMEYPRAQKAVIIDAKTGKEYFVTAGHTNNALEYEIQDMEDAVLNGKKEIMRLADTKDVMEIMTKLRKDWNLKYPGEVW